MYFNKERDSEYVHYSEERETLSMYAIMEKRETLSTYAIMGKRERH